MRDLIINGPVGKLEGKYFQSTNPNAPVALVLHPHTLHGGTMNNKVVYTIFHTLVKLNFSVLRFNFPGTGNSAGQYDHGIGELASAAIALDWLQNQNPEASRYWVAGFSFGAWIALQLLMRRPEVNSFIAVAPPANLHNFNFLSPCPTPGLIIHGQDDTTTPEDATYKLYCLLEDQTSFPIDYRVIAGADHSFKGKLQELAQLIEDYINSNPIKEGIRKKRKDRRRRYNTDSD